MAKLLQAELHYLDGNLELAEQAYKASITSARDHRFVSAEAMAYELFGIFCLENQMVHRGMEQLHAAVNKYKEWGAHRKVLELQDFMDTVDPASLRNLNINV